MSALPSSPVWRFALPVAALLNSFGAVAQDPPTRAFRGFVAANGAPASDVRVWATRCGFDDAVLGETRTDREGRFSLPGLPLDPSGFQVWSTAPGKTREVAYFTPSMLPPTSSELRLQDAVAIRCTVVSPQDEPIAGVHVVATRDESTWPASLQPNDGAVSDENGEAVLAKLPPGVITLRAWAPGFAFTTWQIEVSESTTHAKVAIERATGASLDVRVLGLQPGQTAEVCVHGLFISSDTLLPRARWRGETDERGAWARSGLSPGYFTVTAFAPGLFVEPQRVQVSDTGEHRVALTATPQPESPVRGVLRDSNGKPVAGETIWVSPRYGWGQSVMIRTDDAGRFATRIPARAGSVAMLSLFESRYVWPKDKPTIPIEPGTTGPFTLGGHDFVVGQHDELALRAELGASIAGWLEDGQGHALANTVVSLAIVNGLDASRYAHSLRFTTTDDDGRFEFAGLEPQATPVHVTVPSKATQGEPAIASDAITIEAGRRVEGVHAWFGTR